MENERFDRQNSRPNDAAERNNSELNRGNQETTNTLHSAVTASLGSQTGVKSLYSGQVQDGTFSSSLQEKADDGTYSNNYIYVRTGSESSPTSQTKRKSLLSRLSVETNMYESIGSGLNHSIMQTDLNPYEDVISGSEILHPLLLLPAESNVYESIDSGLDDSIRPIDSTPHDEVLSGSQIEHSCPPARESNDRRGCSKKQMALVIVLLVTLIVTSVGVDIWKILEPNDGLHMHVPPKELTASQRIFHPNVSSYCVPPGKGVDWFF